jgi:tetratricopeptide (TPR) repeat protein
MRNLRFLLSLFLIFIFFLPVYSSQESTLDELFNKLKNTENYKDADTLEKKIWAVWNKHPKNKDLTEKLELGTELMYEGSYSYALRVFDNIIRTDPGWSEAWNKRATLLFFMKNFEKSLEDIRVVLSIEPRHFGALSGQAQIYIELKEYEKAIKSLKKANQIHPVSRGNKLIPSLEKIIKEQSI